MFFNRSLPSFTSDRNTISRSLSALRKCLRPRKEHLPYHPSSKIVHSSQQYFIVGRGMIDRLADDLNLGVICSGSQERIIFDQKIAEIGKISSKCKPVHRGELTLHAAIICMKYLHPIPESFSIPSIFQYLGSLSPSKLLEVLHLYRIDQILLFLRDEDQSQQFAQLLCKNQSIINFLKKDEGKVRIFMDDADWVDMSTNLMDLIQGILGKTTAKTSIYKKMAFLGSNTRLPIPLATQRKLKFTQSSSFNHDQFPQSQGQVTSTQRPKLSLTSSKKMLLLKKQSVRSSLMSRNSQQSLRSSNMQQRKKSKQFLSGKDRNSKDNDNLAQILAAGLKTSGSRKGKLARHSNFLILKNMDIQEEIEHLKARLAGLSSSKYDPVEESSLDKPSSINAAQPSEKEVSDIVPPQCVIKMFYLFYQRGYGIAMLRVQENKKLFKKNGKLKQKFEVKLLGEEGKVILFGEIEEWEDPCKSQKLLNSEGLIYQRSQNSKIDEEDQQKCTFYRNQLCSFYEWTISSNKQLCERFANSQMPNPNPYRNFLHLKAKPPQKTFFLLGYVRKINNYFFLKKCYELSLLNFEYSDIYYAGVRRKLVCADKLNYFTIPNCSITNVLLNVNCNQIYQTQRIVLSSRLKSYFTPIQKQQAIAMKQSQNCSYFRISVIEHLAKFNQENSNPFRLILDPMDYVKSNNRSKKDRQKEKEKIKRGKVVWESKASSLQRSLKRTSFKSSIKVLPPEYICDSILEEINHSFVNLIENSGHSSHNQFSIANLPQGSKHQLHHTSMLCINTIYSTNSVPPLTYVPTQFPTKEKEQQFIQTIKTDSGIKIVRTIISGGYAGRTVKVVCGLGERAATKKRERVWRDVPQKQINYLKNSINLSCKMTIHAPEEVNNDRLPVYGQKITTFLSTLIFGPRLVARAVSTLKLFSSAPNPHIYLQTYLPVRQKHYIFTLPVELIQRFTGVNLYKWKETTLPSQTFNKKNRNFLQKRASNALTLTNNSKAGGCSIDSNKHKSIKITDSKCIVSFKILEQVRDSQKKLQQKGFNDKQKKKSVSSSNDSQIIPKFYQKSKFSNQISNNIMQDNRITPVLSNSGKPSLQFSFSNRMEFKKELASRLKSRFLRHTALKWKDGGIILVVKLFDDWEELQIRGDEVAVKNVWPKQEDNSQPAAIELLLLKYKDQSLSKMDIYNTESLSQIQIEHIYIKCSPDLHHQYTNKIMLSSLMSIDQQNAKKCFKFKRMSMKNRKDSMKSRRGSITKRTSIQKSKPMLTMKLNQGQVEDKGKMYNYGAIIDLAKRVSQSYASIKTKLKKQRFSSFIMANPVASISPNSPSMLNVELIQDEVHINAMDGRTLAVWSKDQMDETFPFWSKLGGYCKKRFIMRVMRDDDLVRVLQG